VQGGVVFLQRKTQDRATKILFCCAERSRSHNEICFTLHEKLKLVQPKSPAWGVAQCFAGDRTSMNGTWTETRWRAGGDRSQVESKKEIKLDKAV
jgi:hypothetical protein